jgi:hypothetical protein
VRGCVAASLDELSSIAGFLAWKLQGVTSICGFPSGDDHD